MYLWLAWNSLCSSGWPQFTATFQLPSPKRWYYTHVASLLVTPSLSEPSHGPDLLHQISL